MLTAYCLLMKVPCLNKLKCRSHDMVGWMFYFFFFFLLFSSFEWFIKRYAHSILTPDEESIRGHWPCAFTRKGFAFEGEKKRSEMPTPCIEGKISWYQTQHFVIHLIVAWISTMRFFTRLLGGEMGIAYQSILCLTEVGNHLSSPPSLWF